jgi:hypothetical protein
MYTLKKIEIELPKNYIEIGNQDKPDSLELIIVDEYFLNASGHISEIIVRFIFEAIANGVLIKAGEDVYDYLKKIILKNNGSKDKSCLKFQIKSKNFTVNFSGDNLNSKNTEKALKEFGKFLDKTQKYSTNDQIMVFNEISNKWEFNDCVKSNLMDNLINKAIDELND